MELRKTILELGRRLKEKEEVIKKRCIYFEEFEKMEIPSFKRGLGMQIDSSKIDFDIVKVELENLEPKIRVLEGSPDIDFESNFSDCINKFECLHNALQINVSIVVKKNDIVKIEIEPVQFQSINIVCEEGSSLVVFEKDGLKNNHNSIILNIKGKKDSRIDYIALQNNSRESILYSKRVADLEEDARINWYCIELGADINITQLITNLNGKEAGAENNSLLFLSDEQQADLFSTIVHNAKNTKSNVLIKGGLLGGSRAVLRGLIKIGEDAKFSSGSQKIDGVLLSDAAKVNTIPDLEIKNSEVSCSHSASVSEIDEEKLFYLESRGISRNKALSLLLTGFFEPVLSKIELLNVRALVVKMIEKELDRMEEGVKAYA